MKIGNCINKSVAVPLTSQQYELIERMGVLGGEAGLQPSASRIAALLLVCDKTELTFDEIRETLKLSKSATSTGITILLSGNKIEYITKTGDRKRYFRSRINTLEDVFKEEFEKVNIMKNLFHEIKSIRTPETPEFNSKLSDVIDFISFVLEELPRIYEVWETKKRTK